MRLGNIFFTRRILFVVARRVNKPVELKVSFVVGQAQIAGLAGPGLDVYAQDRPSGPTLRARGRLMKPKPQPGSNTVMPGSTWGPTSLFGDSASRRSGLISMYCTHHGQRCGFGNPSTAAAGVSGVLSFSLINRLSFH